MAVTRYEARGSAREPDGTLCRHARGNEEGDLLRRNTPCLCGDVLSLGSYLAPRPDWQGILRCGALTVNPRGD